MHPAFTADSTYTYPYPLARSLDSVTEEVQSLRVMATLADAKMKEASLLQSWGRVVLATQPEIFNAQLKDVFLFKEEYFTTHDRRPKLEVRLSAEEVARLLPFPDKVPTSTDDPVFTGRYSAFALYTPYLQALYRHLTLCKSDSSAHWEELKASLLKGQPKRVLYPVELRTKQGKYARGTKAIYVVEPCEDSRPYYLDSASSHRVYVSESLNMSAVGKYRFADTFLSETECLTQFKDAASLEQELPKLPLAAYLPYARAYCQLLRRDDPDLLSAGWLKQGDVGGNYGTFRGSFRCWYRTASGFLFPLNLRFHETKASGWQRTGQEWVLEVMSPILITPEDSPSDLLDNIPNEPTVDSRRTTQFYSAGDKVMPFLRKLGVTHIGATQSVIERLEQEEKSGASPSRFVSAS